MPQRGRSALIQEYRARLDGWFVKAVPAVAEVLLRLVALRRFTRLSPAAIYERPLRAKDFPANSQELREKVLLVSCRTEYTKL